ncbi:MAG TPA: ribosome silencing factor [Myxococcales bacterium]|jgi:ribosome-associated protein|nr:ribosome silencing factor [Myxococcales bacterium]
MAKSTAKTTAKTTRTPVRKKTEARAQPAESPARHSALDIAQLALEKKALDVVVLDVRGLASYAEYIVVMSAESEPQLNAIADNIETKMKERGERPYSIEGTRAGQWILMDFGDVVAHLFYKDTRDFYDIEGLWADAERTLVQ